MAKIPSAALRFLAERIAEYVEPYHISDDTDAFTRAVVNAAYPTARWDGGAWVVSAERMRFDADTPIP